jgi:hypothetical protein
MTKEQAEKIIRDVLIDNHFTFTERNTDLVEKLAEALTASSVKVPEWPSEGAVGDWYSIWAESHTGKDGYSRFKAIMAFYSWLREKWAIDKMRKEEV